MTGGASGDVQAIALFEASIPIDADFDPRILIQTMQPAPTAFPVATPRPILGRIGAVLHVVRTLIAYGQYFTATVTARAAEPQFATVAAVFGTYDLATIRFRVKRGILRALALQRYLLARAARGRNLRFVWPPYVDLQPHHRRPAPPRAKPAEPRRGRSPPNPAARPARNRRCSATTIRARSTSPPMRNWMPKCAAVRLAAP